MEPLSYDTQIVVTVHSHYFLVNKVNPRARVAVDTFAKKLVHYGYRRTNNSYVKAALKVYAAATVNRSEYRFHINSLQAFYQHLESHYLPANSIKTITVPPPVPVNVEFTIKPHIQLREGQREVVDYITETLTNPNASRSKLVTLQTGKGKGICTMWAMMEIGVRTLIIVKPMYLDKWTDELKQVFELEPEDMLVVRGADQLNSLTNLAKEGLINSKIILISNKTFQRWLSTYEQLTNGMTDLGYGCFPADLCEALGVGIRIIDEVHQDFHLNFKIDLYTNVRQTVSLSATLISEDPFTARMHELAYPAATRFVGPAYDKYIAATAIIYRLEKPHAVQSIDRNSGNYNHHLFEKSILGNSTMQKNYFLLINKVIQAYYFKDYKPGQKVVIFCISIDMCTALTAYLARLYPDFSVLRYVEDDPRSNLLEPDIRVTTLQSGGTAVDIPNLTTTILTIAIASSQANIQGLGRTRPIADITPDFVFFACMDIPKHLEYYDRKKTMLEDRTVSFKTVHINEKI